MTSRRMPARVPSETLNRMQAKPRELITARRLSRTGKLLPFIVIPYRRQEFGMAVAADHATKSRHFASSDGQNCPYT
jgi:hypothetical protein